ncbi:tubulin-like doman-containing protein [Propionibacteriaceae bacterium Y2011]
MGCGGSGGATLAYMMDQLTSDLAIWGKSIPKGWQFVHLDVPSGEEAGPDGLGNVQVQGGRYLGLGPQSGSYGDLDHALSQKLIGARALETLATWAPRAPQSVPTPISVGAGQYRAVGRAITLVRAGDVRQTIQAAYDDLFRVETTTEMTQLAQAAGGRFEPNEPPIVLVVSSMAGGAGASMALDVCRLMSLAGVDPRMMAVFMVSSDIFDSLPESARTGVRANALAMLGEIVASQSGAARAHDVQVLSALGHRDGAGAEVPFARVFPVGRTIGAQRTTFGTGRPEAIYRGLARGLAGMMVSPVATAQFQQFDLGNTGSVSPDPKYFGWGANTDPLPWGSFGFASLSMGRDRYAEYAAQRLARGSVDRLLDGHLQPGNPASSLEQLNVLLDSQFGPILSQMGLPVGGGGNPTADMGNWMTASALPRQAAEGAARFVTDNEVSGYIPNPDGQQASQWMVMLQHQLNSRRHPLTEACNAAAYEWAFRWKDELLERIEGVTGEAVTRLGLPYAAAVLDRLSVHLREYVIPGAESLAEHTPPDIVALPPQVQQTMAGVKGVVSNGAQIHEMITSGIRGHARTQIYAHASGLVSRVLQGLLSEVLPTMINSLKDTQRLLENARASDVRHDGLARLATDQYGAWPSDADSQVPSRFDEANNEVLLTTSRQFMNQFVADVQRAITDGPQNLAGAREAVISSVVSGLWQTTGGEQAPGGLVERTSDWRPRAFAFDPSTGDSIVPSQSRYDFHVRPAELLTRARMFVGRRGESFDRFTSVSLRDFVMGVDARESEKAQRVTDLASKFSQTLALAQPLIGVNDKAVQTLHGRGVEYRYKFSQIPFADLPIVADLRKVLEGNPLIDSSSMTNLNKALSDQGDPRRVDVFGSYPLYSPLAFESVLKPVGVQWGSTPPAGRAGFWTYRRARPLNASLPMGDTERQAMVAGWFLGQVLGEIRLPDSPYNRPVEIWDREAGNWSSFPHPLLTPPGAFKATYDWLPAVLESVMLAQTQIHEAPVMGSLRPYVLLRELYDSNPLGVSTGILDKEAERRLTEWFRSGRTASGQPSRVPSIAAATTIEERATATREWLTVIKDLAGVHFLPAGRDGAPGGGSFSEITTRDQASQTPIFRDLAPDIWHVMRSLLQIVDTAEERAKQVEQPKQSLGGTPQSTTIEMPDGGVF